jgi:hypothetical protein
LPFAAFSYHISSNYCLSLSLYGYEIDRQREQERAREREQGGGGQLKKHPPGHFEIVLPFAAFSYHISSNYCLSLSLSCYGYEIGRDRERERERGRERERERGAYKGKPARPP